jgi:hypothetical protein
MSFLLASVVHPPRETEMDEILSTLRIARSAEGQWFGRILIGSTELILTACKSPQEVERVVKEIGLHPGRVEVED